MLIEVVKVRKCSRMREKQMDDGISVSFEAYIDTAHSTAGATTTN